MDIDFKSMVENEIFKSIHLISDAKLRTANFTSLLIGIISFIDAGDPYHYKVSYQGNNIDVYSVGGQTYNLGESVIILYSNSDFNQKKFILASSLKIGNSSTVLKSQIYYGSFYSSQDQSAAAINTEYKYTFNSINKNYGILLGDGITTGPTGATSVMRFSNSGVYNVQVGIQLQNNDADEQAATIWLKKNNTNLSNSAVVIDLSKKKATAAFRGFRTYTFITEVSSNDYLEMAYSYTSLNLSIWTQAAGITWPASPSISANIHLIK